MSDYCHEFDPGGLGCGRWTNLGPHDPCPKHCLGDFTSTAISRHKELHRGEEVSLGLCEGHGAWMILFKNKKGEFWVDHVRLDDGKVLAELSRKWDPPKEESDGGTM